MSTGAKSSRSDSISASGESSGFPTAPRAAQKGGWLERKGLVALLLGAVVIVAYGRMWQAGFVWDDDAHLVGPGLTSASGLWRIWTEPGATQQYYPAVYSLFWLEHQLWGYSALGYHFANVALHAGVALLLYRLLRRLCVPGALLAASAFAVHPVCVESVAWISEQKNTLSALFCLAAALAYLRFEERRARGWYAFATVLYAASLLSKTVTATLPVCLLILAWWRRGRLSWKADLAPLVPWLAMGATAGMLTAWVERVYVGAGGPTFGLGPLQRLLLACRVPWFYAGKAFWPADLMFIYPRWSIDAKDPSQYLCPALVVAVAAVLFSLRRRFRGTLAAVLLFVGTLFPALGFVDVYPFRFSFVADHFQYLALAVAISATSAGLTVAAASFSPAVQRALCGVSFCAVAVLGLLTWRQTAMYSDMGTLWRSTIARNPGCWMAYNNLGLTLASEGRLEEAAGQYRKALEIYPDFAGARTNLGAALLQEGRVGEAIANFRAALALDPGSAETHNDLGMAFRVDGQLDKAVDQYRQVLGIKPDDLGANFNLGNALLQMGRVGESIGCYQRALEINPLYEGAHNNLGNALRRLGRNEEAIAQYRDALEIDPTDARARRNLEGLLSARGS